MRAERATPLCLGLLSVAVIRPAIAQQEAPTGVLQEVVVTATKRQSTVQSTPISLTAIAGAEIQERGVADLTELLQSVPGVSLRTSGPGQTELEMRGMASTGGNSPTVGFYLGDTPLTGPAESNNGKAVIDPNLYDLNRVEVLRGPQGTLYGSGSMGGTVKLVPNAPNPAAFSASGELLAGDTDGGGFNHGENAMANLPFGGGTAALRVVGSYSHDSGWIDRIVIANGDFPLETNNNTVRGNVLAAPVANDYKDVNYSDVKSARASLLWQPVESLTITPMVFYQSLTMGGLSDIDSNPGRDAFYQPFDVPEPFSDRVDLASLDLNYSTAYFDITSTTSRWTRSEILTQDGSESWQWALGLSSFYVAQGGIGPSTSVENDRSMQTSEELRVTSNGSSPFQWLVGYFYEDFESQWIDFLTAPGAASLLGTGNLFTQDQPTKIIQQSVFSELSYQLTSQLKATVGARRYSYQSSIDTIESGAVSLTGSDATASFPNAERNQGINPKLNLSYVPSKELLLYVTAAKGFRPGGGNLVLPTSGVVGAACEQNLQAIYGTTSYVPAPTGFGPDEVWDYELGEKFQASDGHFSVNSAVYFENWNRVQQEIPIPCGYDFDANVGDAHIYGGEIEASAIPLTGLVVSANAAYAHAAMYSSSLINAGFEPGTPLQDVPKWTSSAQVSYRYPISAQLTSLVRLDNTYVGSRTDSTYTINTLPAYDLTNVRLGVEAERWSAVLFAKNVFNERALLNNIANIAVNMPTYNRVAVSQPLTVGVDLTYRFGH